MTPDPELVRAGLALLSFSAAGGFLLYTFADNLETYGRVRKDLKKYSVDDIREEYKDCLSSIGRELAILFSKKS